MSHTASAVAPGVEPSIWPSLEACRAALGSDWYGDMAFNAFGAAAMEAAAKGVAAWLGGSVAATAAAVPTLAVGTAIFVGSTFGNYVGEQVFEGGEPNCDRIARRVAATDMLGVTLTDMAFTIEACIPPPDGWEVTPACQPVGPYRPFSGEMATIPGDASTLGRNELDAVTFVARPVGSGDPQPGDGDGVLEGTYALEAVQSIEGDGARLAQTWAGEFTVDEVGRVSGTGSGTAVSEGACSIGDEAHAYSFSTAWDFAVSGSSDGTQIDLLLTPTAPPVLSEGPGTEAGEACVELARDFAAGLGSAPLGVEPYEITLPAGGGSIRLGGGDYWFDIAATRLD